MTKHPLNPGTRIHPRKPYRADGREYRTGTVRERLVACCGLVYGLHLDGYANAHGPLTVDLPARKVRAMR